MVLLHQSSYRCSHLGVHGLGLASRECASRTCPCHNTHQTSGSLGHVFLSSGNCVPSVGPSMGRFNLCLEQWPYHRPACSLWGSDHRLCCCSDPHARDGNNSCQVNYSQEYSHCSSLHFLCGGLHDDDDLLHSSLVYVPLPYLPFIN